MPDTLSITGAAAELRWGSSVAASLGAWSVTGDPSSWKFTAEIATSNSFRIAQRPLTVVTPNGWRWSVVSMDVSGSALVATIQSMEQMVR
jgi:hypothetical protein